MPSNYGLKGFATHHQKPILGHANNGSGLFKDMPEGGSIFRSPYQMHFEDFNNPIRTGAFEASGWTHSIIGAGTGADEIVDAETGYLLLHPGSVDDGGFSLAYNVAADAVTTATPPLNLLGEIDCTATLMDSRELMFNYRVGFSSESAAWQGKALFGWITDDIACMAPATGVPTLKAEGGIGFHIGETGVLGVFSQTATLTAAPTNVTGTNVLDDIALVSAEAFVWYNLGFRTRWGDAGTGIGHTDFFVNGRLTNTITNGLPMDGTGTYSTRFEVINGPAGKEIDIAIDSIASGITRPGLTWPYDTGNF